MSDVLKRILCVALALVVVFSFSACRHSPVLEQTIYSQDAETDPNNQQTDNDIEHTEENTTLPPKTTQQTASRQSEQTKVSAKPKPTTNNNRNNDNTNNPNSNTSSRTGNENVQPTGAKPSNNDNSNKAQGEIPDVNPDPNANHSAVDDRADFNPEKLPENVATVAAVGPAAPFVEMLGGQNRLLATSANFKQNVMASLIDSNFANIEVIGEGNANAVINDNQFDLLLRKNPEAVFYVSDTSYGSFTFSDAQLTELTNHKIYAIPLHPFNTTKNIKENVEVMGRVLGKRSDIQGSKDANEMAKKYIEWMDTIGDGFGHTFSGTNKWNLDEEGPFSNKGEEGSYEDQGQYTILIDGWDPSVATARENGVAYARTGYTIRNSPASFYLSLGGAANTAVLITDNGGGIPYFPIVPTYMDLTGANVNGSYQKADAWRRKSNQVTGYLGNYIGSQTMNKIIVDSATTYNNILGSAAWQATSYIPMGDGAYDWGVISNGTFVKSNIHGALGSEFELIINPYGVGSWTEGSPEAPLEALWADQLFYHNLPAEDAFNAIIPEIQNFYLEFYGYNLSEGDLNTIKAGGY